MDLTITTTEANRAKLELAARAWRLLLESALERGFNGTATLEIAVQGGTIQHVRRRLEQTER